MSNNIAPRSGFQVIYDEEMRRLAELQLEMAKHSIYGDSPPPPTCTKVYRVKDTGPESLRGRTFSAHEVVVDTWLNKVTIKDYMSGVYHELPRRDVELITAHSFPNTGAQRSWCAQCGVEGLFDWRTGLFEVKK